MVSIHDKYARKVIDVGFSLKCKDQASLAYCNQFREDAYLDLALYEMVVHACVYGRGFLELVENDMGTAAGVDNPGRENTRTIVTFNVWIPVSKYIIIVPEVDFWDYGDKEEEGQDDVDLGKASIYGINWLMVF